MNALWILAALLHAGAALGCALPRERASVRRALPLAALFAGAALGCALVPTVDPSRDDAGWQLALALLAALTGLFAVLACIAHRRLALEAAHARAKASALEEEQRRYVEESSSHLEASRARFRALADAAPLGVIELDGEGACTYVSARWAELTDSPRDAARGDGWLAAVHADERTAFQAAWQRARERGEPFAAEFRGAAATPKVRAFFVQLVRRAESSGPEGWVGTLSDVSERRAAEDERRRLETRILHAQKLESLGVLAGGMAHDFNNLLVGILGNLHALKQQVTHGGDAELYLARAETAALRASELARDMLGYAGRGGVQLEPVDLPAIVEELVSLLEVSRPTDTVLHCELDRDLPALDADPTQLRQLVLNLLTNALEACAGAHCRVVVRVGRARVEELTSEETFTGESFHAGEALYLEVADTGRGMDADTAARMFDPFFTTKPHGRGLGLAVVLGVVRRLHGALRVRSEPGRGTSVRVLFRASQRSAIASEGGRMEAQG